VTIIKNYTAEQQNADLKLHNQRRYQQ